MSDLTGKVAVVTGATAGIGRVTAVRLAELGARQIITGRNQSEADKTLAQIEAAGGKAAFVPQDVTDAIDWQRVMETTRKRYGRLDVLVNNAGSFFIKPLEDTSLEEFRGLWKINVDSVFLGTQAAMPLMKDNGGGSIINVSSLAGLVGLDQCVAYCSSKAGCVMFSKAAALEGAPYQIRVNAITPGPVWTDMIARQYGDTPEMRNFFSEDQPLKVLGLPEDVAAGIAYLASDGSRFVTGTALTIDAGRGAD